MSRICFRKNLVRVHMCILVHGGRVVCERCWTGVEGRVGGWGC